MARKLRIVIIGYYGRLNAGDALLRDSLSNIFRDHDLLFTSWFPGVDFLNLADLVVVGGGSIWPGNPVFQNAKALARTLKTPLVVLGISAKHSDKKIKAETRYLIDKSVYFHVRDSKTKDIIGNDSIVVGTDLYWWSDHYLPQSQSRDFDTAALNLRSWDAAIWRPQDINEVVAKVFRRVIPFPFYFGSQHASSVTMNDIQLLKSLGYADTPGSFTVSCLQESTVTVAMRFHALLVSIRAGIPAVGFNYHNKTKALFSENGIPELCVPLDRPNSLRHALQHLREDYPRYQSLILKIRDNYLVSAQNDRAKFLSILNNIAPREEDGLTRIRRLAKRYLARWASG